MVVEPKTFYNFEKSLTTEPPSVERLHGIHKSFSNKYDLIFRVHKYKKTPMFSFCEPRQKSVSLESKHLEFMTDTWLTSFLSFFAAVLHFVAYIQNILNQYCLDHQWYPNSDLEDER